ncbi:DNA-binding protein eta2 [Tritrichomonas foetus]|uniref:DNA-binding protein eta2 n=1 Tax=Tritrichomonas foetus TaxID=1144522 RepID=A0A1J4K729_9EUKA|nr:DNA-binding protein eta2 [Tritrichomonas foetus]|eukprot:OHT06995.1 DNA-binding protein eta2 [Tritrichomonas foetus]
MYTSDSIVYFDEISHFLNGFDSAIHFSIEIFCALFKKIRKNMEFRQTQFFQILNTGNRRFTEVEDQKLRELVGQFGARRWRQIAMCLPGRTARQCRDRYCNYLSPDFYNGEWTDQEDQLLIEKYQELGSQWTKLAVFFPGKNANNIKNRWNYRVSRLVQNETTQNSDNTNSSHFTSESNISHEIHTNRDFSNSDESLSRSESEKEFQNIIMIPPDLLTFSQVPTLDKNRVRNKVLFPPITTLLSVSSK